MADGSGQPVYNGFNFLGGVCVGVLAVTVGMVVVFMGMVFMLVVWMFMVVRI